MTSQFKNKSLLHTGIAEQGHMNTTAIFFGEKGDDCMYKSLLLYTVKMPHFYILEGDKLL